MSFVDTSDIRAYIREPSASYICLLRDFPSLAFFPRNSSARNSLLPLEPRNHVSRPQLLLFPKLVLFLSFSVRCVVSPSHVERIVRDKSFRRWPSDLLIQCPAAGNSLDQTQSFPFEWYARTSKLWLPNHRRYALSVWPDTGCLCNAGEVWRAANTSYLIDGSHECSGYFNRGVSCMGENSRAALWHLPED